MSFAEVEGETHIGLPTEVGVVHHIVLAFGEERHVGAELVLEAAAQLTADAPAARSPSIITIIRNVVLLTIRFPPTVNGVHFTSDTHGRIKIETAHNGNQVLGLHRDTTPVPTLHTFQSQTGAVVAVQTVDIEHQATGVRHSRTTITVVEAVINLVGGAHHRTVELGVLVLHLVPFFVVKGFVVLRESERNRHHQSEGN